MNNYTGLIYANLDDIHIIVGVDTLRKRHTKMTAYPFFKAVENYLKEPHYIPKTPHIGMYCPTCHADKDTEGHKADCTYANLEKTYGRVRAEAIKEICSIIRSTYLLSPADDLYLSFDVAEGYVQVLPLEDTVLPSSLTQHRGGLMELLDIVRNF